MTVRTGPSIFQKSAVLGHGVAALFFFLIAAWVFGALGGLSFEVPKVFNGHPLFMAAFVSLFAHSALTYRSSPFQERATRKWWHMVTHGVAFACAGRSRV